MGNIEKNLLLGILFTIFFSCFTFIFIPIAVEMTDTQGITPATWPSFVSLFICFIAIVLTIVAANELRKGNKTSDQRAERFDRGKFFLTTICLISFYFLVNYLGIVLASMIIFFLFSIKVLNSHNTFWGDRNPPRCHNRFARFLERGILIHLSQTKLFQGQNFCNFYTQTSLPLHPDL